MRVYSVPPASTAAWRQSLLLNHELRRTPLGRSSQYWPSTGLGECLGPPKQGYLTSMTQEADYYTAHEVARLLGISPARVRQMLRAGELEGERGPALPEGVPGPWRVPAGAVRAYGEGRNALAAADADETVALPPQEITPSTPRAAPGVSSPEGLLPEEAPTETSERLSEGVGALRDKAAEIIEELDLLESRLEAAEIEHIAVRDAAGREKERAEKLQAALDAERSGRQEEHPGSWR